MLKAAFPRAFSGRLSWVPAYVWHCDICGCVSGKAQGLTTAPTCCAQPMRQRNKLEYCTGQYWPTEYRRAVCAVLASAIWEFWRAACMPEPKVIQHGNADNLPMRTELRYKGLSGGDFLRRMARNEFGRGIASRWFN